jgi:2-dehydro-3-deoxygluconokinase
MPSVIDTVAIGEPMVEFNQARSDDGRTYLQGFGGDTSNAVIAAARQGARCAYVSRVGDDVFGRQCLALWQREGVDTSAVAVDPDAHTGIYFVHHGPQGHSFTYLRAQSAASHMTPADIPAGLIRQAKFLHVSGISQAISATAQEAVAHAIGIARNAGVKVSYDPNLRLALWTLERAREVILTTMASCDEFLPSLDDLRLVSGLDDPREIVAWSHRMGAASVVLKLGSRGALVSDGDRCIDVAPFPVNAIDATGAGDCFDGSYLARRATGDDSVTAARWANAAAALATTGYGAVDPLPRSELIARLVASSVR